MVSAVIQTCRPRQWVKNLIIFAAYIFSLGERTLVLENELSMLIKVITAFFAFSLLSSSIYILNDIQDRETDRVHPKKCKRPIASGRLSIHAAYAALFVVFALAMVLCFSINMLFAATGIIYLILFTLYSFGLKRVVILDVLLISFGFILRAVAGGVAIDVRISGWLIICTLFLALFLGYAKRRSELVSLGDDAAKHRDSLRKYTVSQLDSYLAICAALSVICYTMYTVSQWSFQQVGYDGLLTLPFVILGVFRYLHLVFARSEGTDPSNIVTKDIPLLLVVTCWLGSWLFLKIVNPQLLAKIIVL